MSNKSYLKLNQSVTICKIIAACMVIFLHGIAFPGNGEAVMKALARFSVPIFFATSGYYSYNIDDKHILKRISHMLVIIIISSIIYAFVDTILAVFTNNANAFEYIKYLLSVPRLARTVFLNDNSFTGHLWYLSAMLTVYLIFWIYTKLYQDKNKKMNYNSLYIIGIAALLVHIVFDAKAHSYGQDLLMSHRNGLFFGLPMFCMGLFIRENQALITDKFNLNTRKEVTIIVIGSLLSIFERLGIGDVELTTGALIEVFAIMMLITSHPVLFKSKKAAKFIYMIKDSSLAIYIIHIAYRDTINAYVDKMDFFRQLKSMQYLYPLIFIAVSLISGIVFSLIKYGITNAVRKK